MREADTALKLKRPKPCRARGGFFVLSSLFSALTAKQATRILRNLSEASMSSILSR